MTSQQFICAEFHGKGDLVTSPRGAGLPYRVTSVHGTKSNGYVRLLPYQRSGGEVFIACLSG